MNVSAVKYWLLLVCVLGAVYGSFVFWRRGHAETARTPAAKSFAVSEPQTAPLTDFTLTDQDGKDFDSASLKGKIWVGSYFFTNCPAICWRLNQALAGIQAANPSSDVRYISMTCDPDNDTPEVLTKYAAHFHADPARWTFLTGDAKLIEKIGNDYFKVAVARETHSDRAFVVDRTGQVRGRFRLTEPDQVELLKKLIDMLQDESTPEPVSAPAEASTPATTGG